MKVTQIFGLVLLFHLVAIGLILLQPGCQTRHPPTAPDTASRAQTGTASQATTPTTQTRPDAVPASARHEPTRPVGTSTTRRPSASSSDGLDPAFNAGLTGTTGPILQPVFGDAGDEDSGTDFSTVRYTVVAGDSLSRIAREYGVTVNAIKSANNLTSNTIRVGQELNIPSPSAPTQTVDVDAAGSEVYTVRAGDTLSGIAARYGVTVTDLRSANALRSDTIRVGQELFIPGTRATTSRSSADSGTRSSTSPAPSGSTSTYTVQAGDTPSGIARRFGVDYRELMRINNIASANRMQVGQELIIPAGGRTTTASQPPRTTERAPAQREQTGTTSRTASLAPQPSQPARIQTPQTDLDDPFAALELLESDDIPLMDVEVVDPSSNNN